MGRTESRRGEREKAFQVLYGLNFVPAVDQDQLAFLFAESPASGGEPAEALIAATPESEVVAVIQSIERRSGSTAQSMDARIIRGLTSGLSVTYAELEHRRGAVEQHIHALNQTLAEKGCAFKLAVSKTRPLRVEPRAAGAKQAGPAPAKKALRKPEGFAWDLAYGVWSKQEELDRIIASLSQHWRIERIAKIELTILRLALFEILHRPDIPVKVAINEAIELAKQFGDENSRGFVNGILDAAAKAVEHGEIGVH